MDKIKVKVANPESPSVTLWERHPAHPGGEIWLSGAGSFDVAATSAVMAQVRAGKLIVVKSGPAPAPEPEVEINPKEKPAASSAAGVKEPVAKKEEALDEALTPPLETTKDSDGALRRGQVEESTEEVSVVTRLEGDGAGASRPQKKPRGTS